MKRIKVFLGLMILINTTLSAKVILPAVIDNHMVLQRSAVVPLWGKAKPGTKVTVKTSWNNKLYSITAQGDSSWRIGVSTPVAGGPYTITFNDGDILTLKDVLIGEVWVCSGQSNMSMPVKGFKNQPIEGSEELLLHAENPEIRLMQIQRQFSVRPEFDAKVSSWTAADRESVADFSAVGYIYAKLLQEKLKIPVGVIMTAWGGTKIEAWIKQAQPNGAGKINHNSATVLYNAMINPIVGYGIKGVIWYQGEANRSNYQQYDRLMEELVKGWRKAWNIGDWPFYYVQIAPFKYDGTNTSAFLREAQLKASKLIPNCGMVVSVDVGKEAFIHAPDKTTIARRLASWALARNYGMKKLAYASPVYQSIDVKGDSITVYFDHTAKGLSTFGKDLTGFEIAGQDKVFHTATARVTGASVIVRSEMVKEPVALRYAFKDWVVGSLYNTEGLPAAPFRTDDW